MYTKTAYTRETDGTLTRVQITCLSDEPGCLYIGAGYNPQEITHSGTTELRGWGSDDGEADVYTTQAGRQIIIPERIKSQIAAHLTESD